MKEKADRTQCEEAHMIRLILRIYQNTLDAIYVSLLLSGLFRVTRTRPCELSVEKNIEEGTSSTFMKIQTNEIRGGWAFL